jgi:hypothetical protein
MIYNGSKSIYITWDHSIRNNVAYYRIYRSDNINGDYQEIAIIPYPQNDYGDQNGSPFNFYKVEELDTNLISLSMMGPFVGEEALIKASLYYQIRDLLELQVRDELGIFDKTRTKINFQHSNWTYWNPIEARIASPDPNDGGWQFLSDNQPILTTVKDSNNYPEGLLIKPNYQGTIYTVNSTGEPYPIQSYDNVVASYQVRLFTVGEMNDALQMALSGITALPGTPKIHFISQAPIMWEAALIAGAGYFLMRNLQTRILNKQTKRLLLDSEITPDYIKSIAKEYKEDYEKYKETLPYSQFPRIFSIVAPTSSMPGGMSRMYRQLWHSGVG